MKTVSEALHKSQATSASLREGAHIEVLHALFRTELLPANFLASGSMTLSVSHVRFLGYKLDRPLAHFDAEETTVGSLFKRLNKISFTQLKASDGRNAEVVPIGCMTATPSTGRQPYTKASDPQRVQRRSLEHAQPWRAQGRRFERSLAQSPTLLKTGVSKADTKHGIPKTPSWQVLRSSEVTAGAEFVESLPFSLQRQPLSMQHIMDIALGKADMATAFISAPVGSVFDSTTRAGALLRFSSGAHVEAAKQANRAAPSSSNALATEVGGDIALTLKEKIALQTLGHAYSPESERKVMADVRSQGRMQQGAAQFARELLGGYEMAEPELLAKRFFLIIFDSSLGKAAGDKTKSGMVFLRAFEVELRRILPPDATYQFIGLPAGKAFKRCSDPECKDAEGFRSKTASPKQGTEGRDIKPWLQCEKCKKSRNKMDIGAVNMVSQFYHLLMTQGTLRF
ncbi:hypothetical protein JCM11641_001887 [Rhodosporidiobolus odoratus]